MWPFRGVISIWETRQQRLTSLVKVTYFFYSNIKQTSILWVWRICNQPERHLPGFNLVSQFPMMNPLWPFESTSLLKKQHRVLALILPRPQVPRQFVSQHLDSLSYFTEVLRMRALEKCSVQLHKWIDTFIWNFSRFPRKKFYSLSLTLISETGYPQISLPCPRSCISKAI